MFDGSLLTDLIPLKMASAVAVFDQYVDGWNLAQIEASEKPEPRRFVGEVMFDTPFTYTPLVHVGLAGFDIDNKDSNRLSVHAQEITHDGFKVVVETWMHTCVYKVEISWLALGT